MPVSSLELTRRQVLGGLGASASLLVPSGCTRAASEVASTPPSSVPLVEAVELEDIAYRRLLAHEPERATSLSVDTGAHAGLRAALEDQSPLGQDAYPLWHDLPQQLERMGAHSPAPRSVLRLPGEDVVKTERSWWSWIDGESNGGHDRVVGLPAVASALLLIGAPGEPPAEPATAAASPLALAGASGPAPASVEEVEAGDEPDSDVEASGPDVEGSEHGVIAPEAGVMVSEAGVPKPKTPTKPLADEYSAISDGGFRYRGTSFGFGARFTTIFFECGEFSFGPCALSPFVGATAEVGYRKVRVAFDLHTAPMPLLDYDFIIINVLTAGLGVAAGNESYRAIFLLQGGYFWYGLELRALLAPWHGKNGGRHGIDLGISWALFYVGAATVSYRWFPPALNLRSRLER